MLNSRRLAIRRSGILHGLAFWFAAMGGLSAAGYEKVVISRSTVRSPDETDRAIVAKYRPWFYGLGESRVDMRTARGRLLGSADFANGGTQGYLVKQTAWSRNSRFFVFSVTSSGGHSPWNTPMFFFDLRRRSFYMLNPLSQGGVITIPSFKMTRSDTVLVKGRERWTHIYLGKLTNIERTTAQSRAREFLEELHGER